MTVSLHGKWEFFAMSVFDSHPPLSYYFIRAGLWRVLKSGLALKPWLFFFIPIEDALMSKPGPVMIGGRSTHTWHQKRAVISTLLDDLDLDLASFRGRHRAPPRLRVCAREPHGHAERPGRGHRCAAVPVVHRRWTRCVWGTFVATHYCHNREMLFEVCVFGEQIWLRLGAVCLGKVPLSSLSS